MTQDGQSFPSRRKADKDADLPSGAPVLPGKYNFVIKYLENVETTTITVKSDPRRATKMDDLKESQKTYTDYMTKVNKATEAYNNIIAAKEAIKMTESILSTQHDTVQTNMKNMHKELNKKIEAIDKMFFEPENQKGITRSADNLSNAIFSGMGYMRAREGDVGDNGEIAMKVANDKIEKTIKAVNEFFATEWPKYQTMVDGLKPISIKKFEPVKF
jgi:hypothetical protein